jgi:hypothetical protein
MTARMPLRSGYAVGLFNSNGRCMRRTSCAQLAALCRCGPNPRVYSEIAAKYSTSKFSHHQCWPGDPKESTCFLDRWSIS